MSEAMTEEILRFNELEAEIERLRADYEAMKKWALDSDETNDRLRAENERLRRGIELFLSGDQPRPPCNHGVDDISDCWICADHYFQKLIALEQNVRQEN